MSGVPGMGAIGSTEIRVQADAVDEIHLRLAQHSASLSDMLTTLWNEIEPLRDTWSGHSESNFQEIRREYWDAAHGLVGDAGVLGDIQRTMRTVASNYAAGEEANIRTWQART